MASASRSTLLRGAENGFSSKPPARLARHRHLRLRKLPAGLRPFAAPDRYEVVSTITFDARHSQAAENHVAFILLLQCLSLRKISPSFITKKTRSVTWISRSGLPGTATISAVLPMAREP